MDDGIVAELTAAGLRRVRTCEPMKRHTSWRVGGPADVFGIAESVDALRATVAVAERRGIPWLVLGGGNNVLAADAGVDGLVILNRLKDLDIEEVTADGEDSGPVLRAGAGVFFAQAAQYSAKRGYSGLEWGIAIPGTVGAGVINNAGAHQGDVARSLIRADAIDRAGRPLTLTPEDLRYRYRGSALKGPVVTQPDLIITACRFRLVPDDSGAPTQIINELLRVRSASQPIDQPSAGSTFTNPPGHHAGALIERAGLKGRRIGGAEISRRHANFIVNVGDATAQDIVDLIALAQREVRCLFGVQLEPEIQLVGRWPEGVPELCTSRHESSV